MIWSKFIQPRLISLACTSKPIRKQREKVVPKADGTVLEIGFGSGHNLPYYNKKNIDKIIGLEPSVHMQKLSKKKLKGFDVNLIEWKMFYTRLIFPTFSGKMSILGQVLSEISTFKV